MDSHTIGPGFKTQLVRYFLAVERLLVCEESRGRISRSGLTQNRVFQCDVPHQSITQRQVSPASSTVKDTVPGWGVMSCVCGMAFLCGSTLVKVHCYKQATSRYDLRCFKATLNPKQNKSATVVITHLFVKNTNLKNLINHDI